jgi:hypothetical protein
MGDIVNSDYALSKEIYLELIDQLEADWEDTQSNEEQDEVAEFAHLLNSGFLCGLRGEEIVKLDILGFLKYLNIAAKDPKYPHVVNPLIGRLKGETGEKFHPIIMARVTASGVMAGRWADRLAASLLRRGRKNGFICVNKRDDQARIGQFDDIFKERLSRAQVEKPYQFDPMVSIGEVYSLGRSLKRGSTSAATNSGVTRYIVELNNRWRKMEQSRGRKASMSMAAHYTEIKLMLPTLWKYLSSF